MTKVYLEQDGNRYTVDARGHATGSDVVCASVSTLVSALHNWIKAGGVAVVHDELSPGKVRIVFTGGEAERAVFDLICVGFLQLEKAQPEYISVQKNFGKSEKLGRDMKRHSV